MGFWKDLFVEVRRGSKVTYSPSDLSKLDRSYEHEVWEQAKRKVLSPFRKEMQYSFMAQVRDYAFERILDRHLYTFSHLLVIPNPYGMAQQTALLLFNSSKEYKVRYCVQGEEGADFVAETEMTKRHRVAIMGLYFDRSNKVDLYLLDENDQIVKHRMIRIYVGEATSNSPEIISKVEKDAELQLPIVLVNGEIYRPMAIDGNGAVRYALQLRTSRMGMIPLQNGQFLFADRTANCVNSLGQVQHVRYHEMDYMGRVYRTFIIQEPIGILAVEQGDFLYMSMASDKEHINDCILKLDMNSGDVVSKFNLSEVLGEKYRTVSDWTKMSHMECRDGKLILSLRRLHTVICLDAKSMKTEFVLAQPGVWDGTPLEASLLQPESEEDILNLGWPCSATWKEEDVLFVFNSKARGEIPQGYSDTTSSEVIELQINQEKRTFHCLYRHDCDRTMNYGSARPLEDQKMLYLQGAVQYKTEGRAAVIRMLDPVKDREGSRITLSMEYINAWEFRPDITSYSKALDAREKCVFGNLNMPEEFHGELPPLTEEKLPKKFFRKPHMCDNLFLFFMLPGAISRIYFKGEQHCYVQDYSMLKNGNSSEIFAIQVDGFAPDEYYIYLEFAGMARRLKNEIRVME